MSFMSHGMKSQSALRVVVARVFFFCARLEHCMEWLLLSPFSDCFGSGALVMRARLFASAGIENDFQRTYTRYCNGRKWTVKRIEPKQRIYQIASITERNITLFAILCALVGALSCTLCTFLPFCQGFALSHTVFFLPVRRWISRSMLFASPLMCIAYCVCVYFYRFSTYTKSFQTTNTSKHINRKL